MMKLIAGATVSAMSKQQWMTLRGQTTHQFKPYEGKPLQRYSKCKVQVIRQVTVDVKYGSQKNNLHCSLWLERA